MKQINVVLKKTPGENEWSVIWDDVEVYRRSGEDAEFYVGAFADGLERGITGSRDPLCANSQVRINGVIYRVAPENPDAGEY